MALGPPAESGQVPPPATLDAEAPPVGTRDGDSLAPGGRSQRSLIDLTVGYPDRLSRWRLFLKWLFVIPLYAYVAVYSWLANLVTLAAFLAILFSGSYPLGLFNFVRGYISCQYRVYAYFPMLLTDHWRPDDAHPLLFTAEPPVRLSRLLLVFVKLPLYVLGIPQVLSAAAFLVSLSAVIPAWFAILLFGGYPRGFFDFAVSIMRWSARLTAWQYLLRDEATLFGERTPVRYTSYAGAAVLVLALPVIYVATFSGFLQEQLESLVGIDDAERAVVRFMEAGEANDLDSAFAATTGEPEKRAQVRALLAIRYLFEGFQSTNLKGWEINSGSDGTFAVLEGDVIYAGPPSGSFRAVLVKRDDTWLIDSIFINRAPR